MNMLTFEDSLTREDMKNQATTNMKIQEVLNNLDIDIFCGIYMKNDKFLTNSSIVNFHFTKSSHWII